MTSRPNTLDSQPRAKVPCAASWTAPPRIVAESLESVPEPLLTVLHPGPPSTGAGVAGALVRALAPEEAIEPPPAWLLPEQVQSFRRALATIRRHGGAVLADSVGSGKTYVALAVAAALNHGPTACLVPAGLQAQWGGIAASLGVPVVLCSHEQVSRGRLPSHSRGLVLIDESHHFRNPATRRYRNVASWLTGRAALMITATPVVNRATDLSEQLRLAVRDDALLLDGIASLRALLVQGRTSASLGQLVIEGRPADSRRPGIVRGNSSATRPECRAMDQMVEWVSRLRLSRSAPIAALLRRVLLRSAGSSPAALRGSLSRYRRLLLHAQDARRSGQVLDRSEIRRFTAELGDQLIWWELLPPTNMACEIELKDLAEIDDLIHSVERLSAGRDDKLDRLRAILSDGVPSLIFTGFRQTVRYIRDRTADSRLAWCTGEKAGIGPTAMRRSAVLSWFRAGTQDDLGPKHLLVTDVAAEGLNLQRAGRVIHYDLPWTPMRLDQREGRSVRYGSTYQHVEVVRFTPPPNLERWLGMERLLKRKGALPATLGLGRDGRRVWRWRSELASRFTTLSPAGTAVVVDEREGILAGFTLHGGGSSGWLPSTLLWLERDGSWTEEPELLESRLQQAAESLDIVPADPARVRGWLVLLAPVIKERLALAGSWRWITPEPTPSVRRVAARLQVLTREAARLHRPSRLIQLEHATAFVTRGHTAGETAFIERLADSSDAEFERALRRVRPQSPRWEGIEARLAGLILFGPAT